MVYSSLEAELNVLFSEFVLLRAHKNMAINVQSLSR